jgi:hypothetical protein
VRPDRLRFTLRLTLVIALMAAVAGASPVQAQRKDGRPKGSKPDITRKAKREAERRRERAGGIRPADQVIADDLIVDGNACVGVSCANLEVFPLPLKAKNGNTPGIRLEQDASGGFTARSWDVAGNEANFFIRDVTGGSTLPLRIFPGSTSNNLVLRDSSVGIGTVDPQALLHLADQDAPPQIRFQRNTPEGPEWEVGQRDNGTFMIDSLGAARTEVLVTGDGLFRVAPVRRAPRTGRAKGAMYNDTSGALCWYSGKRWLKVVGNGRCR